MLASATVADAPVVLRLRNAAADWLVARGIDQWRRGDVSESALSARAAAGELFVVRHHAGIAAAVVVRYADEQIWGPNDGHAGYVHMLVIDRAHTGTGLGRQVLTEAENVIASTGRRLARLDCVAGNPPLVAYYRQAGYAEVGRRETRYGPVALFEKPLTPAPAEPVRTPGSGQASR